MGDPRVLERIGAWQAAGIIDADMAERLRAAEATAAVEAPVLPVPSSGLGSWLRFSVTDLFAYLGVGFLLAAYYWGVSKVVGATWEDGTGWAMGVGIAAAVFLVVGYLGRERDDLVGRAAGPLLLVGGFQIFFAVTFLFVDIPSAALLTTVAATLVWVGAAMLARRALASLPTQVGLLAAIVSLAWAVSGWVGPILFGTPEYRNVAGYVAGPNAARAVAFIAWMLATAAAVGFIAEGEAHGSQADAGAGRRASLSRFWAGMTAVIGTSMGMIGLYRGFQERELPSFIGVGILLAVSGLLVVLALRRNATSYLIPAGLGVVIGLTDLNGQYVAADLGLGPALLLEGVALLGVGYGTELMRRRLARRAR